MNERIASCQELEEVLDRDVRPYLRQHGGDIVVKKWEQGELQLAFKGECKTCLSAQITFETVVKKHLPDCVKKVSIVNDTDQELLDLAKAILSKTKIL